MSPAQNVLSLTLRRRGDDGEPVTSVRQVPAAQAALVLCDVWDRHWSRGAAERVEVLAPVIDQVARHLRSLGVLVVHAPSDTLDFYAGHPARQRALDVPAVAPPSAPIAPEPPLPIDDSDGGSDTGETSMPAVWTRQHPAIAIEDGDAISDDGDEIYSLLRQEKRDVVLLAGVHTNMCVLRRSFGLRNLVRWGLSPVLLRDLTDAMYNPAMPPYVSHQRGTELVVEHIERYLCPTALGADLLPPA
ncbi:Nicotinamidase-related amidase [Actinopolymorpha cephalotaxi]|uniref:Nicotinamidase-related amidase n=1 Tax=Actinopolymorpha cephalotaxi TaxID=504797 RepID=A0A1I2XDM5_9ACTN|nr:isochorismatase family protein [Actinopolymorpha cephalotaxi]NYH86176.1 nicotinamidase-related amidase [Actinopolymorpha cephalotaxi]SFH11099.1 Nicotinamidase-related amidase [Actinopolymorpha cephalotaxi]